MDEIYTFLKQCETYYLATVEGDKPRVRPFGTIEIFEGKLYIQTGKIKKVSAQMHANPKIEICGMKGGSWIRVEATAVAEDNQAAAAHMLEAYPMLKSSYAPDDGNCEVWYLTEATAVIESFGGEPRTIRF